MIFAVLIAAGFFTVVGALGCLGYAFLMACNRIEGEPDGF